MLNDTKLPETVGNARSKIFILSRFSGNIGVPAYFGWADDTSFELDDLYIQDNYNISDIEEKKSDILNTIEYARNNDNKLVINFTSCYLDPGFPPSYAGTTALAINPWLKEEISIRTTLSREQDKNVIRYIDTLVKEMTEGK